jgi:hypothetical protein
VEHRNGLFFPFLRRDKEQILQRKHSLSTFK